MVPKQIILGMELLVTLTGSYPIIIISKVFNLSLNILLTTEPIEVALYRQRHGFFSVPHPFQYRALDVREVSFKCIPHVCEITFPE